MGKSATRTVERIAVSVLSLLEPEIQANYDKTYDTHTHILVAVTIQDINHLIVIKLKPNQPNLSKQHYQHFIEC